MERKKIKINGFEITYSFSDEKSDDYILNKTIANIILDDERKCEDNEDDSCVA